MITRLLWEKCCNFKGKDALWIECTDNEVEKHILPLKNDFDFVEKIKQVAGHSKINENANESIYRNFFLVSTDLKNIESHPWVMPYSGMWNAGNPFMQFTPMLIDSLDDLQDKFNEAYSSIMKKDDEKDRFTYTSDLGLETIPKFTILMGGVCSGKTHYRKEQVSSDVVQIDAGDIFIELSKGAYYDFPSHLEDEMNTIGIKALRQAFVEKKDVLMEFVGADPLLVEELINQIKSVGYNAEIKCLTCDIETAKKRNKNRGDDNISAYYSEGYHFEWLNEIVTDIIKNKE